MLFGIGKSRKDSASEKAHSAAPAADAPAHEEKLPLPTGLAEVCPEAGDVRQRYYIDPAHRLHRVLNTAVISADCVGDFPTRIRWQYRLAAESVNMLETFPTQAVANVRGEYRWDFHRVAYLRGLLAGLGAWMRDHEFWPPSGNKPISPIDEDLPEGTQVSPRHERRQHLRIAPGVGELLLFQRLGWDQLTAALDPVVRSLLLDSFGADAHERNLLAKACEKAMLKNRKRLTNRGLSLEGISGIHWLRGGRRAEAVPPQEPIAAQALRPWDKSGRGQETAAKRLERLQNAGIDPQQPLQQGPNLGSDEGGQVHSQALVEWLKRKLQTGQIIINQQGALIHGTEHGPGLVVPKALDLMAHELDEPVERISEVAQALFDPKLSTPSKRYRIKRSRRGHAKVALYVFKPGVAAELFQDGVIEPNPDIQCDEPGNKTVA